MPNHARTLRFAIVALAALLVSTGWPASAARADDDSNIPGIPLPGNVVTGSLGGPVYDRVYSIDVPPSSVILASMTGTAGTDFDLYLFDSSASTVYQTQGQVTQSTGPTSTESISYPTPGGGRFYIDLNGASNVEGTFRLAVSVLRDSTPPEASLKINGGAVATNSEIVTVVLIGTDDLSGVDKMELSSDGTTWGDLVDYTPTFLWGFPTGDGRKDLYARVFDRAGNVSATAHASIVLDTVAPQVAKRLPGPGGLAGGTRPTLSVQFDEAIQPASWTNNGLIVQRADNTVVAGTYAYDAASRTGTFVPAAPLTPGDQLTLSVGSIVDLAGNPVTPIGSWVIRVVSEHSITVAAAPGVVTSGGTARIVGRIDTPVLAQMTLEASTGGSWTTVGPVDTDEAGNFSVPVTPLENTSYRVRVGTSQSEAGSVSASVRVAARRKVALSGISGTTIRTTPVGRSIALTAVVSPASPSTTVTATIQRLDSVTKHWLTVSIVKRSTLNGRASFSWRPAVRGAWTIRLTTPPSAAFANGVSALYQWNVA
jgi:hypothetical protein